MQISSKVNFSSCRRPRRPGGVGTGARVGSGLGEGVACGVEEAAGAGVYTVPAAETGGIELSSGRMGEPVFFWQPHSSINRSSSAAGNLFFMGRSQLKVVFIAWQKSVYRVRPKCKYFMTSQRFGDNRCTAHSLQKHGGRV